MGLGLGVVGFGGWGRIGVPGVQEAVVLEASSAEEGLVGMQGLGARQGLHGGAAENNIPWYYTQYSQ